MTKDGDSAAGEEVGQHQKRLVPQEGEVTVLWAGARDEQDRRVGSLRPRQGEGAGELELRLRVLEAHIEYVVRVRLLRLLGAADRGRLLDPKEREREGRAVLGPLALDFSPAGVELTGVFVPATATRT